MIRTWDIASGKCIAALTNHKKSVRALAFHPNEYTFCSAAPDNIKVWKCPEGFYLINLNIYIFITYIKNISFLGIFMRNISGHNAIINTVSINKDNVLVSGADNGSLYFWDWKSGYNFQKI
jgi:pleiotropic regulator 1